MEFGEIIIIGLIIVGPILVAYGIIQLVFKNLERTFSGRIILGLLIIGVGIFILIALPQFLGFSIEFFGITFIVLGIIWLLLEIFLPVKKKR